MYYFVWFNYNIQESIKTGKIQYIEENSKKIILVEIPDKNEVVSPTQNIDKELVIKLQAQLEATNNENKLLKQQIEDLKKEKEELKYQIKDKDFKINQLFEKLENLNDRVIGLIEWKNKAWWQRIFKKQGGK